MERPSPPRGVRAVTWAAAPLRALPASTRAALALAGVLCLGAAALGTGDLLRAYAAGVEPAPDHPLAYLRALATAVTVHGVVLQRLDAPWMPALPAVVRAGGAVAAAGGVAGFAVSLVAWVARAAAGALARHPRALASTPSAEPGAGIGVLLLAALLVGVLGLAAVLVRDARRCVLPAPDDLL